MLCFLSMCYLFVAVMRNCDWFPHECRSRGGEGPFASAALQSGADFPQGYRLLRAKLRQAHSIGAALAARRRCEGAAQTRLRPQARYGRKHLRHGEVADGLRETVHGGFQQPAELRREKRAGNFHFVFAMFRAKPFPAGPMCAVCGLCGREQRGKLIASR